jgi:glycosyltransferase involved in cell wall biosynthesis
MARTTIVVPCYNEAERLDCGSFQRFSCLDHEIKFLFVDDGSTDETNSLLESLRKSDPTKFGLLTLEKNQGKAEAVRQGFLTAFESDCDYVGFWDADLATPLDAITVFLELMGKHPDAEIVFGSRVKLLGRHIERRPARHYLGRFFATVVSITLGIGI